MNASIDENLPDAPDGAPSRMPLLWLQHHPLFWFFCAIPPLFVLGALVAGTIYQATQIETRHGRYLKALERSYQNSDFSAASRYFRKLQRDNYRANENALFIESLLLLRAGLADESEDSLAAVAPDDRQGFRPAHLWRAKDLAARQTTLTRNELLSTRHHLECALGMEESDVWVRSTLGTICTALNDYEAAAEHIGLIAPENPTHYVMLAAIHKQLGNTDSQIGAMTKARDFFLEEFRKEPEVRQNCLSLAVLQFQLGDRQAAMKTVIVGLRIHSNDRELRNLYSELLLSEYDEAQADEEDPARGIKILRSALELSPENSRALSRLQELLRGESDRSNAARKILSDMLVRGEAVDTVHFILGVQCVNKGDLNKAAFHFRQSFDQTDESNRSKTPVLLNNLAWLMKEQDTNLPEALKLIEQAIELLPQNDARMPYLRETRGQIHIALKNWQQAIKDLEYALKGLPENAVKSVHLSLFQAYTEIGLTDVAEKHKEIAAPAGQ